jgi:hypothetical protein
VVRRPGHTRRVDTFSRAKNRTTRFAATFEDCLESGHIGFLVGFIEVTKKVIVTCNHYFYEYICCPPTGYLKAQYKSLSERTI